MVCRRNEWEVAANGWGVTGNEWEVQTRRATPAASSGSSDSPGGAQRRHLGPDEALSTTLVEVLADNVGAGLLRARTDVDELEAEPGVFVLVNPLEPQRL